MASFYSGEYVGAVVVDVGSCDTKMGWAGDDAPRSYFRSVRIDVCVCVQCVLGCVCVLHVLCMLVCCIFV